MEKPLRLALAAFAVLLALAPANAAVKQAAPELPLASHHVSSKFLPDLTKRKHGVKMSFAQRAALKIAQKKIGKTHSGKRSKVLVYLLCFLLPPLAVWLCWKWESHCFPINLVLTLMFWLPGVVHAFVMCSKYFRKKT